MDDERRRPGRPPRDERALTGAERARAYRERRKAQAQARPDVPHGAMFMLVSLALSGYRDHRREAHFRSVLGNMPPAVRRVAAQIGADFWSNGSAPVFWDAYLRWHAADPERWPLPERPARRLGRRGAGREQDGHDDD